VKDDDKIFLKIGVVGAILASLCCLEPLILITLWIGIVSSVLSIGYDEPYFLAIAIVFFYRCQLALFQEETESCL